MFIFHNALKCYQEDGISGSAWEYNLDIFTEICWWSRDVIGYDFKYHISFLTGYNA